MAPLSSPVARMAAGGLFLLFLFPFLTPGAAAQVPDLSQPDRAAVDFVVVAPEAYVEVDYNSNTQVSLFVKDLSRDSGYEPTTGASSPVPPFIHTVNLRVANITPPDAQGWQVLLGLPTIFMTGGQTIEVPVTFQTTPLLDTDEIFVDIEAVYDGPNGIQRNQTVRLGAQVGEYDQAMARILNNAQRAGQNEIVRYQIMVTNDAVFPDTYAITVTTDKENFRVVPPPNLYVPPKTTKYTNITVLTPKGKIYELGQTAVLTAQVKSTTGSGVYSTVGVLQVRGGYVSTPWIPVLLVGLVSASIVIRERTLQSELRAKERGRPRRVEPTPRQTVLLAELKRKDPEAYETKRAALLAVYAQRRETYKGARKERAATEREERKQARIEMKEERKRLKAEKLAAKKQAKLDRKAAKKQAKVDAKAAKAAAKLQKKEDKVLGKKRKVLEKERAKLEKKRAKVEAKEAAAQAKAQKAADRAARKEARAAKKKGQGP